jgi:hypothetical protein
MVAEATRRQESRRGFRVLDFDIAGVEELIIEAGTKQDQELEIV